MSENLLHRNPWAVDLTENLFLPDVAVWLREEMFWYYLMGAITHRLISSQLQANLGALDFAIHFDSLCHSDASRKRKQKAHRKQKQTTTKSTLLPLNDGNCEWGNKISDSLSGKSANCSQLHKQIAIKTDLSSCGFSRWPWLDVTSKGQCACAVQGRDKRAEITYCWDHSAVASCFSGWETRHRI